MTNKDKYNLTEKQIKEIAQEIDIIIQNDENVANVEQATIEFFNKRVRPTLTEDERVILRNIDKDLKTISRYNNGLYLHFAKQGKMYFLMYNHLFQFIKERRRIFNK